MEESGYKGTRFVGNVPDSAHSPYPVISTSPPLSVLFNYMRPSDIQSMLLATALGPSLYVLWERSNPSISYRHIPKSLLFIQIPAFASFGVIWALKNSLCNYFKLIIVRFWGKSENTIEVERWNNFQM